MIGKQLLQRVVPVIAVLGVGLATTIGSSGAAMAAQGNRVSNASLAAAAPSRHAPKGMTRAELEAYIKAHPPTAAQVAAAIAYLKAHPIHPQISYPKTAKHHSGVTPDISIGWSSDHIDVYLTPTDTENIW